MKRIKIATLLITMLAFFACTDKKDSKQVFFPKPPEETLDSIGTFLSNKDNYKKDNYLPLFETHFNQQIANNNIDSAARLLTLAGYCSAWHYDTVLAQKQIAFLTKYKHQIKQRFWTELYFNLEFTFTDIEPEKSKAYCKTITNVIPENYYSALNIGRANLGMMIYFRKMAQYDSAIVYGQKAMTIYEKNKFISGQMDVNLQLGGIYSSMHNYNEGVKYKDKALELALIKRDSTLIFELMFSKIIDYYNMDSDLLNSYADTIANFERKWQPNDPQYKLTAQSALAMKYVRDSNYIEAGKILKNLAPAYPLVKDTYYTYFYELVLGQYENALNKPLTLKKNYIEILEEAKKYKDFRLVHDYCDVLRAEAISLKDYKNAYEYLKTQALASDSVIQSKIRLETSELDKKYQTEKKEAQIKQQAEDAFRKNIFIILLLAGFAALFYFYYTLKKKNTIIAQQNELNEHTISILSHDIKEPLLGVKLLLKKLNKDDPFVAQASQSLENQVNAVNGILTNLLKVKKMALTQSKEKTSANVSAVVQNVLQELAYAIQYKNLTIDNQLSATFTLPISAEKLQIIVHNLLSNAVKYSFQDQTIKIYETNNGFYIQDFGVGLSEEQRSKLMREVTASQQGTKQERGNGMGLFLVGAMLQGEQIKVMFDSPEVGGTIVKVLA